jgi:peptide/nickel transport system permease protein
MAPSTMSLPAVFSMVLAGAFLFLLLGGRVFVVSDVANNILLESSLTFLGLGVDPLIPSWGGMLADGRTYMQTAWWVSVFPGLAIMTTGLGFNFLGDWRRDFIDPTRANV